MPQNKKQGMYVVFGMQIQTHPHSQNQMFPRRVLLRRGTY